MAGPFLVLNAIVMMRGCQSAVHLSIFPEYFFIFDKFTLATDLKGKSVFQEFTVPISRKVFYFGVMQAPEKRQRGRPRAFNASPEANAVQSLDRGLRILSIVAEADGLSLSEVAERSGIAASTAYRMLTTLETHGMVEFEKTEQLWSIGVATYRMGAAFLRRRKLADRARTVMQDLMERTGETANLGVAEEDCVVFISQVETHQAIRAFFRPGTRSPFHASGIGKAVLANLPAERVMQIVRRTGLEAFTGRTLADAPALTGDLAEIRRRGWSVDDEERFPGMRCVASAIFNEYGEPIGGISVSGPSARVTPERVAQLGPMVRAAAAEVTGMIGGRAAEVM
jgi:IclR family acetate operon transcriptional repressor